MIAGILIGAALGITLMCLLNIAKDPYDEVQDVATAALELANKYATRLVNARNYITSTSDVEFDQHELLAIIDGREAEWQAIKK